MDNMTLLKRLERPQKTVDVVLDTDAYNEIDDQFAIAYLLNAGDRVNLQALYAAPFYAFFNPHSTSAEDGMERSYQEIHKLLKLAGREDMAEHVFRGAAQFLPDESTPVLSDAVRDLIARANARPADDPLYVLAIGAITNVASALLAEPGIREKIVIVWLGGHAPQWPDTLEFNMLQDVAAARVVFASGAPLVQLPCNGVVDALRTTAPELNHWLHGHNPLCDYLCENTIREAESYAAGTPWSRVIWDISTVAWLLDREGEMVQDRLTPAPIPEYDHHYGTDGRRHFIRQAWHIDRDKVFTDLFRRLTGK